MSFGPIWMRTRRVTMALVIAALTATPGAGQEQPIEPLVRRSTVLLGRDGGTALFPVSVAANLDPTTVRLRLIDARFESRYDELIRAAIQVDTLLLGEPGITPQIRVTVHPNEGTPPGSYALIVAVGAGQRSGRISLELVLPPGRVEAYPSKLVVDHVLPLTGGVETPVAFDLAETSGTTALTDLSVSTVDLADATGLGVGAHIEWTAPPVSLAPRGTAVVDGFVRGAPTPGTSTGEVVIRSPLLAAPAKVPVEVRTRRSRAWIPLAIGLGLILGFLVRVGLAAWKQTATARRAGLEATQRMRRAAASSPDATFRDAVEKALEELRTGLAPGNDAEAMRKATEKATADFNDAAAKLTTRIRDLEKRVEILVGLTDPGRSLPGPTTREVDALRPWVDDAGRQLAQGDATSAAQTVGRIEAKLPSLRASLADWKDKVGERLTAMASANFPLMEPVGAWLRTPAQTLKDQVAAIDVPAGVELAPDKAVALLDAVHAVRVPLDDLRRWLPQRLEGALDDAEAALAKLSDVQPLQKALAAARAWTDRLRGLQDPEAALAALTREIPALHEQWVSALAGLRGRVPEAKLQAYAQAGAARRYLDALSLIPLPTRETVLGGEAEAEEAVLADATPRADERPWEAPPVPETGRPWGAARAQASAPESLETQLAATRRSQLLATLLQTVAAGLLIGVVGWNLFAPGFVGTFGEITGVFLWGFLLDVSLDVAVAQAATLKPSR